MKEMFQLKERKIYVFVISLIIGASFLFIKEYQSDVDSQIKQYLKEEQTEFEDMKKYLEQTFKTIYQNARMISLLPAIRDIQGGNLALNEPSAAESGRLKREDGEIIQQIYNNLADNPAVSEVYCVLDGFSPDKGERPFFMYDESVLKESSQKSEDRDAQDFPGELEEKKYMWFRENLPLIKSKYLFPEFLNIQDVPAIVSSQLRICDNSQYISESKGNVSDSPGLIMAVPFYNYQEEFRGIIAVILCTNILEVMLLQCPFIPVTDSEKHIAGKEGWRLPESPGRFLLFNKRLGVFISDRRAKGLKNIYQKVMRGSEGHKYYFMESLSLPFLEDWKLFYEGNHEKIDSVKKKIFLYALDKISLVICFGIIFLSLIRNFYRNRDRVLKDIDFKEKINRKEKDRIQELERVYSAVEEEKEKTAKEVEHRRQMEKELKSKVSKLEYMNEMMIDRELKMMDLKKEIAELKKKIKE